MHEISVTQAIVNQAIASARLEGATKIVGVTIGLGSFSGYVDDSVEFYWEILTDKTLAQGSNLHIHRLPGKMSCYTCKKVFKKNQALEKCLYCGSYKLVIEAGDELVLESIEIENDQENSATKKHII
jgi:hydrogenase nickel incorporation protein HypA/HybF